MKWEHAQFMLSRYQFAMRQAQTLIANHNGFDVNGNVTNQHLVDQTMKQMAMYLHDVEDSWESRKPLNTYNVIQ